MQISVSGSSRQSVSGTPISLLKPRSAATCAHVRRAERGEDVLRRRLADRAGDRDEARRAACTDGAPDRRERRERVVRDERRGGAAGERLVEERRTAARPPRRGRPARRAASPPRRRYDVRRRARAAEAAQLLDREWDHVRAPSARSTSRATSRSSNGCVTSPNSWPCSCTLARDQHDVAFARGARSPARSPRAVELDLDVAGAPATISSTIACGSSLRGLSDVTITTSASSDAIRPISGRFSRSRSPPQPKTQMHAAASRARARRWSTRLERDRLVRVVDDHLERLALVDRLEPARHAAHRLDARARSRRRRCRAARAAATAPSAFSTLKRPRSFRSTPRARPARSRRRRRTRSERVGELGSEPPSVLVADVHRGGREPATKSRRFAWK